MKIETRFNELLRDKERKRNEKIELDKLEIKLGIGKGILDKFENSHIVDISNTAIGEFIKVAEYFNVTLDEFIIDPKRGMQSKSKKKVSKSGNPARVITGNEFKRVFEGSKYYRDYEVIPTLLNEVAKKIDSSNGTIVAGVVNNFNLKLIDENVLIRFFCSKGKIFIKRNLFGKSINLDKKKIYEKIYDEYSSRLNKDTIDTEKDVVLLMELVDVYKDK